MTRLAWNAIGERIFEAGVDRGVLYLDNVDGVAWNGLVSVSESPSGGEVTPYYVDGVKYLNHSSAEEFQATLEAFTYPDEFGLCDGTAHVGNGLYVTQQRRKSFGLSYRTMIGDDENGLGHAYKIHLVYDAIAQPSSRENSTTGETIEPGNFSWDIFTKPPSMVGHKPTAHFVIDSRETPSDLLSDIEEILYGSDTEPPRLPSVNELLFIFEGYQAVYLDGGTLVDDVYYIEFDGGHISESYDTELDGGGA